MKILPTAHTNKIVEQEVENDLMVYDLESNKAYVLNETSKIIYRACDGVTSFEEIKKEHSFTDDLIELTLMELSKNGLIQSEYVSSFAGMSRREVIRKVGVTTMVALPLISALSAPTAAQAGSVAACTPNAPGCTTAGNTYTTTQPTSAGCFGDPGRAGCCSCTRGSASYTFASQTCRVTCA